jgi:hypothetical protein
MIPSRLDALESAVNLPIRLAFEELEQQHETARGKNDLDGWMRDEHEKSTCVMIRNCRLC